MLGTGERCFTTADYQFSSAEHRQFDTAEYWRFPAAEHRVDAAAQYRWFSTSQCWNFPAALNGTRTGHPIANDTSGWRWQRHHQQPTHLSGTPYYLASLPSRGRCQATPSFCFQNHKPQRFYENLPLPVRRCHAGGHRHKDLVRR